MRCLIIVALIVGCTAINCQEALQLNFSELVDALNSSTGVGYRQRYCRLAPIPDGCQIDQYLLLSSWNGGESVERLGCVDADGLAANLTWYIDQGVCCGCAPNDVCLAPGGRCELLVECKPMGLCPILDDRYSNTCSHCGNRSGCCIPCSDENDDTPRVAFHCGKVNQHYDYDSHAWLSDSDGASGCYDPAMRGNYNLTIEIREFATIYCQKWYPDARDVAFHRIESINFLQRGNVVLTPFRERTLKCLLGDPSPGPTMSPTSPTNPAMNPSGGPTSPVMNPTGGPTNPTATPTNAPSSVPTLTLTNSTNFPTSAPSAPRPMAPSTAVIVEHEGSWPHVVGNTFMSFGMISTGAVVVSTLAGLPLQSAGDLIEYYQFSGFLAFLSDNQPEGLLEFNARFVPFLGIVKWFGGNAASASQPDQVSSPTPIGRRLLTSTSASSSLSESASASALHDAVSSSSGVNSQSSSLLSNSIFLDVSQSSLPSDAGIRQAQSRIRAMVGTVNAPGSDDAVHRLGLVLGVAVDDMHVLVLISLVVFGSCYTLFAIVWVRLTHKSVAQFWQRLHHLFVLCFSLVWLFAALTLRTASWWILPGLLVQAASLAILWDARKKVLSMPPPPEPFEKVQYLFYHRELNYDARLWFLVPLIGNGLQMLCAVTLPFSSGVKLGGVFLVGFIELGLTISSFPYCTRIRNALRILLLCTRQCQLLLMFFLPADLLAECLVALNLMAQVFLLACFAVNVYGVVRKKKEATVEIAKVDVAENGYTSLNPT